jgi:hypothetical protein
VSKIEELLERKNSNSGLKTEITAVEIRHADHVTPIYPQKLALTSLTSGGRLDRLRPQSSFMDLTSKEGYLIKFCMKLIAAISHDNYYSQFHPPFCELVQ